MKAETTRRPPFPACAKALRMKCARQRCQVALRIFAIAPLSPSCASEMTSFTPRKPRRVFQQLNEGHASPTPTLRGKTLADLGKTLDPACDVSA